MTLEEAIKEEKNRSQSGFTCSELSSIKNDDYKREMWERIGTYHLMIVSFLEELLLLKKIVRCRNCGNRCKDGDKFWCKHFKAHVELDDYCSNGFNEQ